MAGLKRVSQIAGAVFAAAVFAAAVAVLVDALHDLSAADLRQQLHSVAALDAIWAVVLTGLSYFILYIYDSTAFAYIGRKLDHGRIAFVSFLGYALSHNLGFGALTGGAVRYRFYTRWGVPPIDVAKVVLFAGLAYYLNAFAVAGALMQFNAYELAKVVELPVWVIRLVGGLCIAADVVYLVWSIAGRPILKVRGSLLAPPRFPLCLLQITVACIEWWFVSEVLYHLLTRADRVPYLYFVATYVIAHVAGLLSHVPGGLGVFETVLLLLLRDDVGAEPLVAAIILFRLIYYLLPLGAALVMFAGYELATHAWFERIARLFRKVE